MILPGQLAIVNRMRRACGRLAAGLPETKPEFRLTWANGVVLVDARGGAAAVVHDSEPCHTSVDAKRAGVRNFRKLLAGGTARKSTSAMDPGRLAESSNQSPDSTRD
jgi:hypothetical protein